LGSGVCAAANLEKADRGPHRDQIGVAHQSRPAATQLEQTCGYERRSNVDKGTKLARNRFIRGRNREVEMANGDSGGIGVLGVIVGALVAVVIGGAVLYSTGTIGHNSSTVKIELPKVTTK
jgi:hypothetical protein